MNCECSVIEGKRMSTLKAKKDKPFDSMIRSTKNNLYTGKNDDKL